MEYGHSDVDVRRRIQVGANAWRNVVGLKHFEKAEREFPEYACYTGMPV